MPGRRSKQPLPSPLEGIRVLEVAGWLAAPCAAALLGDMGAEVIKVEPLQGDAWRHMLPDIEGFTGAENPGFRLDNRGKRSIAIDLGHEEGRDIVRSLATHVDVVVTNLGPARAKRYALSYRDVRRLNPTVIYLQFTGYGANGPLRDRPGFDDVAFWASSGIQAMLTDPGEPPVRGRASIGDHTTALALLSGLLAALVQRQRTGKGQYLQGSLFATGLWVQGDVIQYLLDTGRLPRLPRRTEPSLPLWNSYRLADDSWIMLAMETARFWPGLCRALGLAKDLEEDPELNTNAGMIRRSAEIVAILDEAFAVRRLSKLIPAFTRERIIWAPVAHLQDALRSPQVAANDMLAPLPAGGRTLNLPVRFDGSRVEPRGDAPTIGEHTDEVLSELGFDEQRIEALRRAGTIG